MEKTVYLALFAKSLAYRSEDMNYDIDINKETHEKVQRLQLVE